MRNIDPKTDFNQLGDLKMKRWFDCNLEWFENKNQLDMLTLKNKDFVIQNTTFDFIKRNDKKMRRATTELLEDLQQLHWKRRTVEENNIFSQFHLRKFSDLSKKY